MSALKRVIFAKQWQVLLIRSWFMVHGKKQNALTTNYELRTTNQKGFTLIELMIAISIVAIISAIGLVTYSQAQKLGRDAKRKQDLRSIAIAMELYYQKNKRYPNNDNTWRYSNAANPWIPELTSAYIGDFPKDPSSNGGSPWVDNSYGYSYWSPNGQCDIYAPGTFYILVTQLENKTDPDRNEIKQYKWCDGITLYPTYGWSRYSFIITP